MDAARESARTVQELAAANAARAMLDTQERAELLLVGAAQDAEHLAKEAECDAASFRQDAERQLAAARSRAEELLAGARADANDLVAAARFRVEELTRLTDQHSEAVHTVLTDLRTAAAKDLVAINEQVEQRRAEAGVLMDRAQQAAQCVLDAARAEAAAVGEAARAEREEAQAEVVQARERVKALVADAARRVDDRRKEGEQLYNDALAAARSQRREADELLAAARAEAEEARGTLHAELREIREKFQLQADQQRTTLAAHLTQLRQDADQACERVRAEAEAEARTIRETAGKEAEGLVKAAQRKAETVLSRVKADQARAERMLEEAKQAAQRTSRWRAIRRSGGQVWRLAPWVALAAGVGLAASGEYELARLVGINPYVAPLLPVSIDIYSVTSFRAKKDIYPALLLMASANLSYHLSVRSGIGTPGHPAPWQLTAFVVLIFVAVIWRVHALLDHGDDHRTDGGGPDSDPNPSRTDAGSPHHRTDGRTGGIRTEHAATGSASAPQARTAPAGTDASRTAPYGSPLAQHGARTAPDAPRTNGTSPAPRGAAGVEHQRASTSGYGDRTGTVRPHTETAEPAAVHTGGSVAAGGARTGRTAEDRTDGAGTARTGAGRTGAPRTNTAPVRDDATLLAVIENLPRGEDGFVTINRVRTETGCNRDRAVRLLGEAGLLRPQDAEKHLS